MFTFPYFFFSYKKITFLARNVKPPPNPHLEITTINIFVSVVFFFLPIEAAVIILFYKFEAKIKVKVLFYSKYNYS